jgi:argonaute-like protein implicated in RNA metabolism and viral defense
MERFLRLRSDNNVKKYLEYFRDESNELWGFEKLLRDRTLELYMAYTEMNKLKTKTMKDLPYCLRPHVYALHGIYLNNLPKDGTRVPKEQVKPILKETVIQYVNELSREDQLKLLEGDRPAAAVAAAPAAVPVA